MRTCIGLDVGRSAVKVVAVFGPQNNPQRCELFFKSAFTKAIRLTDPGAVARAALDTIMVNGVSYFVGETAITQGRDDMLGGLSDDWIFGDLHAALLLSAMKRLTLACVPDVETALLCVGLPAHLHASKHKSYAAAVSAFAPKCDIKVIPQSMGPYYSLLFDERGNEQPGFASKSWAIIEVGQFTTDFAMIEHGAAAEHAFGSCDGMRVAAENLQKELQANHSATASLVEASDMLAEPVFKCFGEMIDVSEEVHGAVEPLADIVVNKAQQIFGADLRTLDGICLAGGGAVLIKDAIASKWSKTPSGKVIPAGFILTSDKPRFAVAEGFCRFARAVEISRNWVEAKASPAPTLTPVHAAATTVYPTAHRTAAPVLAKIGG